MGLENMSNIYEKAANPHNAIEHVFRNAAGFLIPTLAIGTIGLGLWEMTKGLRKKDN